MSILTVENVNHDFGGRKILENVNFRLLQGEHVGLVGANGEGKSTLLDIITGKLMPDHGSVVWCNRITTGYLDQHTVLKKGDTIREVLRTAFDDMYQMEQEMLQLYEEMADADENTLNKLMEETALIQHILEQNEFYNIEPKIEKIAKGLGLLDIGLDKDVADLSGGQRSKVLLTKLLLQNPMILILDEPTNYLDAEHIEWLETFLQNYENSFILVSHDVTFLNRVVNVVYHLENSNFIRYKGDYDNFLRMDALKKRQIEQAYDKQQKEIEKLETFIAKNKARVATTNMAKSRQKKLDKMEIIEKVREKIKPEFRFTEARASTRYVTQGIDLVLGYDEPLTSPLKVSLERGEKIAIKGVNGLGKTTLLKTLMGQLKPYDGQVLLGDYLFPGYFEQESSSDNQKTALQEVWDAYPAMTNGEVRGALAKCGLNYEHIETKMMVLSGGENAKVRLCKLMLKEVNWLILDEPTNHLDVDAKASLKKALIDFKGTILLVSHDPEFYEDWVTDIWNVEDWTTKII